MPSRDLTWKLGVQDNASHKFGDVAEAGEKMSSRIGAGIGKLGDAIGGEVGELVSKFSEGFEKIGESGQSNLKKIAVGGAALTGLGVGMQLFASKGQAAEQQLKAAVDATGDSWEDYEGKFESAVSSQAKYGHDTSDVAGALAALTEATQNTDLAFKDLNVTADLAAAKHESLTEAGGQLAKVYAGSTKVLKQFGIDMKVTAGNTDEANAAIAQLGQRLEGQASAQANTFQGHLVAIKTEIEDWGEKIAGVVGGPITYLGAALEGTAGALEILKVRHERAAAAALQDAAAEEASAAATDADATASEADAIAKTKGIGAVGKATAAVGLLAVGVTALSVGLSEQNQFQKAVTVSAEGYMAALQASNGQITDSIRNTNAQALASEGLYTSLEKVGVSQKTLTAASLGDDGAEKDLAKSINAHGFAAQVAGSKVLVMGEGVNKAKDDLKQANTATGDAADSTDALTTSVTAAAAAYREVVPTVESFDDALGKLNGDQLTMRQTEDQLADSMSGLKADLDENSRSLNTSTDAGRKNEEAILSRIQAINAHVTAVYKQTGSTQAATTATNNDEAALRKAATAAGLNKDAVDALIKKYGIVPKDVATKITADTTQAFNALKTVIGQLDYLKQVGDSGDIADYINLAQKVGFSGSATAADPSSRLAPKTAPSKTVSPKHPTSASGGVVGHAAAGTYLVSGGRVTNVDEFGSELLDMGTGRVYPHGQSQQMIRGAGGSGTVINHFHVNVSTLVPSPDTGRLIAAELATWVKSHGGRIAIGAGITD